MGAQDEIPTSAEAARYLRCSRSQLYRMVKAGKIPFFRIGSDLRFTRKSLMEWAEAQMSPAARDAARRGR